MTESPIYKLRHAGCPEINKEEQRHEGVAHARKRSEEFLERLLSRTAGSCTIRTIALNLYLAGWTDAKAEPDD